MVVALGVLLICDNVHHWMAVVSIWAGVHLCHSEGDRLRGSEWMSFMLSHHDVSKGDWFSSGCGVPSFLPVLP